MPDVPPHAPYHRKDLHARVLNYRKPDGTRGFDETGRFEMICGECGDDDNLYYDEVSPEFQKLRGPYVGRKMAEQKLMEHMGLA